MQFHSVPFIAVRVRGVDLVQLSKFCLVQSMQYRSLWRAEAILLGQFYAHKDEARKSHRIRTRQ